MVHFRMLCLKSLTVDSFQSKCQINNNARLLHFSAMPDHVLMINCLWACVSYLRVSIWRHLERLRV